MIKKLKLEFGDILYCTCLFKVIENIGCCTICNNKTMTILNGKWVARGSAKCTHSKGHTYPPIEFKYVAKVKPMMVSAKRINKGVPVYEFYLNYTLNMISYKHENILDKLNTKKLFLTKEDALNYLKLIPTCRDIESTIGKITDRRKTRMTTYCTFNLRENSTLFMFNEFDKTELEDCIYL